MMRSGRRVRQRNVHDWCIAAFGDDHARSIEQRGIRLVEEAIEAGQAAGCSAEMIHRLVDHIYTKPVGDLRQELGGVGVTVLACAEAAGIDADEAERDEVERVLSKPLAHFTARNAAKNAAGFDVTNPGATNLAAAIARAEAAERRAEYWKAEHNAGNAAMEAAERDAERYRWFRHKLTCGKLATDEEVSIIDAKDGSALDAAIDRAIAAQQAEGEDGG